MNDLYPLTFTPIYKEKIWGGSKINSVLGKDFGDIPNCGESWEISGVPDQISVVSQGILEGERLDDLIRKYQGDLVGVSVFEEFGEEFPLLIKFIDANDDLSIQVHPDDTLAQMRHNSRGKTEMWYILQADPGASLICGFNQRLDKVTYQNYFNSGKLLDILNREKVEKDDVFFLPAGRIHTIGRGLLIAEIQQTSDITYRIYDFDRKDDKGNKRELHIEQSLDALDFHFYEEYKTIYSSKFDQVNPLIKCPYFETNILTFNKATERDYSTFDSFVVLICLDGKLNLEYDGRSYTLKKGETMLIPACIESVKLIPDNKFKILETFVPLVK